jgi:60 kDa SS-A/Ro ribonucleoprotein
MPVKKSSSTNKKKPSAAARAMTAQAAQAAVIRNAIPQWFRIDPDQVPNNAGGFVWQISDREQVIRYLIIGSEGGNYYQTPQQVSSTAASCVLRMTRTPDNFKWLIDTIRDVSISGRAAKQEPTLLALATAIVFAPTPATKTEALNAVKDCVRILTHMYMLIGYIKIFSKAGHPTLTATTGSGIGRGIRRVFGEYFYSRSGIEIANLITKYQNREGWTIKDVLTLIHIVPSQMKDDGGRLAIGNVFKTKEEFEQILAAAPPSTEPTKTFFNAIKEIHTIALRSASASASASASPEEMNRIVHLINTVGLCREQLPSQLFKHKKVWEALLLSKGANGKGKGMPLTALIRNLGKLSTAEIGIITPSTTTTPSSSASSSNKAELPSWGGGTLTKYICDRITDAQDIKHSRIHPYNILVAMLTYQNGQGDKGSLKWTPNSQVIAALDKAFKLAFQNITPTGKRIKIALDVSGSMSSAFCTGSPVVNCATGSVAMMFTTLWTENKNREVSAPKGVAPPNGASSALLAASGAMPPPARGGAAYCQSERSSLGLSSVAPPLGGGSPPLWKTTQLLDGRTLYENTKTNECQFTKPQEINNTPASLAGGGAALGAATQAKLPPLGGGTPLPPLGGGTPQYKATKKYLGLPEDQPATATATATATRSSSSYSYYGYNTPLPPAYLPELYPPPATPSNVTICAFSNTLTDLTNSIIGYMDATADPATGLPTMTISDALSLVNLPFSSTDCSLPMIHALKNKEQVDAFVIYTDSETYMGKIHPQAALEEYRQATGIDAKLIIVGMTSNCLTIADPKDMNTLNLAGFDTATPRLINDFISGGLAPQRRSAQGGAQGGDEDEFVILEAAED